MHAVILYVNTHVFVLSIIPCFCMASYIIHWKGVSTVVNVLHVILYVYTFPVIRMSVILC